MLLPKARRAQTLVWSLSRPRHSSSLSFTAPIRARWSGLSPRARIATGVGLGVFVLGTGTLMTRSEDDPFLSRPNPADMAAIKLVPTGRLIGGWIVYTFCSSPTLIEMSESIFNILHKIPVVSYLVDEFARRTFFAQFFAGETAEDSEKHVWGPLRDQKIGVLCAYNIEAGYDEGFSQAQLDVIVDHTLESIRSVGKFGAKVSTPADIANGDIRCWVRTKLTGLTTDPEVLKRATGAIETNRRARGAKEYWPGVPGDGDWNAMMSGKLSVKDHEHLQDIHRILRRVMQEGQKYGVRIIIDAEQSWYQPAIDVFTEELMREFNNGQGPPVACATFQAYLTRNTDLIQTQAKRAQEGGYKLIFKQVRGAYMPYENERWKKLQMSGPSPIWSTKAETDDSYNKGIALALTAIKRRMDDPKAPDVAAIFATHNEVSVDKAIELVEKLGLGTRQSDGTFLLSGFTANRLAFAQIYGMKDGLTNRIAAMLKSDTGLPVVCKSAAYGTLDNALPNLSRRAVENKTVMEGRGGAGTERKRLAREILRRYVPFYS